jgi:hypothetical protein
MKSISISFVLLILLPTSTLAFISSVASRFGILPSTPCTPVSFNSIKSQSSKLWAAAKYKTMEEILAKFPEDLPVLINFYDAKTEDAIKADVVRAKTLLKDRCTLVSIKQQDYPGECFFILYSAYHSTFI